MSVAGRTTANFDCAGGSFVSLGTFEGQFIISDLPPLVPSAGGLSMVELLFGEDVPDRVVVARFAVFEIWENGEPEWVTNWWADDAVQVEGDVVAGSQVVAGLREPQTEYEGACARLMTRDSEVLILEQCDTAGWRMFEVISGDPLRANSPSQPASCHPKGHSEFRVFLISASRRNQLQEASWSSLQSISWSVT